jgi:hypothetical protein|tara:strand:+ start:667 stop:933 length:267 start_codon:yes stop_codon:yes gene_type:complete
MILQTTGMLISNLFLTFICSLSAGFITAIVASNNHVRIVQIAATVNLVFAIGIQITYWDTFPVWYHIVFLVSLAPLFILGGQQRIKQL